MGVLNAGEDTDRHNKVIQGGSKAYAGVVTLFRIISTRNSPEVAGVLCSPSRARVSHSLETTCSVSTPGHNLYIRNPSS